LWIPKETHEVNKDISLLLVEDGQYVEAGTKLSGYFRQTAGVEVTQKNDILELVLKPGELLMVDDPEAVINREARLVSLGRRFYPVTRSSN